jgi:1,4-dihydroxy-2-naphthoyl-CoA synthase
VAEQKSSEEIARTLKLDKGLGLTRLVGTSPARELMFLSDRIDAATARRSEAVHAFMDKRKPAFIGQ